MSGSAPERPYLSIGEVLGLLLEEFPDVTISKIRFLESQGLIDPERTPSGYRKFYDGDVDRLRTILREQKQNFLPLKVIRDRLERGDIESEGGQSTPPRGIRNVTQLPGPTAAAGDAAADAPLVRHHPSAQLRLADASTTGAPSPPRATTARGDGNDAGSGDTGGSTPADADAEADDASTTGARPTGAAAPGPQPDTAARAEISSRDSYSAAELCSFAGISVDQLAEIETFGLITGRGSGAAATYAGSDLAIAEAAAGFLRRGVEGRHLRAWRQAAEREAALFEQLILPHLRQRNPQARRQAAETLQELCRLGGELRSAILASALRQYLDG